LQIAVKSTGLETRVAGHAMKRVQQLGKFLALILLVMRAGAFAQRDHINPDAQRGTAASRLTGAGVAGSRTEVAKAGGADGLGNPLLGGMHRPLYRLRSSDVVEVSFTVAPEFNQSVTVQPDGYVMLKDAGLVEAQGLNLEEFGRAVEKAYAGYLHDPQAAVALKEFEHPYFIVGGEVGKPGKYELRSETTVLEAVEIAGGFTPHSKHSQVVLFRSVDDELLESRVLNLKKMLKQNSLKEDAHLQPGDMVFVPQNAISKISRFLTRPSVSMYMNPSQF
jgi:polysaccharide export outer membrane protein